MKHQNGKGAGERKPDAAGSDPSASSAFDRFEEFARRVISVPKAEIDERERAYREGRGKEKCKPA